ncbi:MAG TPA: hypothetical protein PKC09_08370 [Paracoccus sp. (in: a-proteobacteria)]|uniref:hypothetical protein n=1 Tax=uncultured Paracoccus sp. TaxID=189685 RepID=UPI0026025248|nr:hypothetical protein [uncultured Paracoccus sp.]HMQ41273.1 hypothetical protein [Paracoccus sp. (in: a-proteobacteria)]HMR37538.1 hypothetical protein [Paracoccus sp. (in: a-proteobacteria)]
MKRTFLPAVVIALLGASAVPAQEGAGLMVPGTVYRGLNEAREPARVVFGTDGIVEIAEPGADVAEHYGWQRKGEQICFSDLANPTSFDCLSEEATQVKGGLALRSGGQIWMYLEPDSQAR